MISEYDAAEVGSVSNWKAMIWLYDANKYAICLSMYPFFSNLLGLISFRLVWAFMEADLCHQSPCNVHLKEVNGLRKEFKYKI